jgi:hypothetical protein
MTNDDTTIDVSDLRCCNVCSQKLPREYEAHENVCGACINDGWEDNA